jgi:hypothetical protein
MMAGNLRSHTLATLARKEALKREDADSSIHHHLFTLWKRDQRPPVVCYIHHAPETER